MIHATVVDVEIAQHKKYIAHIWPLALDYAEHGKQTT